MCVNVVPHLQMWLFLYFGTNGTGYCRIACNVHTVCVYLYTYMYMYSIALYMPCFVLPNSTHNH